MQPIHLKPLDVYFFLEGKRESHTLRLPPQASDLLKKHAEAWGMSRSDVVAWCICTALAPQENPSEGAVRKDSEREEKPRIEQQEIVEMREVVERFALAVARFEDTVSQVQGAKAPKAKEKASIVRKEALSEEPESAPTMHLKKHPDFSGWSDGACLDYKLSLDGEEKTIREWIEPLREMGGNVHSNARKSIPRSMRRNQTSPEDLVKKLMRRVG